MEEVWKPIKGYEGIYEVSNHGRVRSLDRDIINLPSGRKPKYISKVKGRILKPMVSKSAPYAKYGFSNGSKNDMTYKTGHRLVAETFLPNPNNLPVVHHKDNSTTNNHVDNLEWTTHQQNTKYAIDCGNHKGGFKKGEKHHCGKLTETQVRSIHKIRALGLSLTEIAETVNCGRGYISEILGGHKRQDVALIINKPTEFVNPQVWHRGCINLTVTNFQY